MTEIWKPIKGYEQEYLISNTGKIKSLPRLTNFGKNLLLTKERILKTGNNGKGYLLVYLSKSNTVKRFYLHRLVAINFIDNPLNKPEVNHIDGNKLNNDSLNLEWCTSKENKVHAIKIGLKTYSKEARKKMSISKQGSKNHMAKKVICLENNMIFNTIREAEKYLGLAPSSIYHSIKRNGSCKGYHLKYLS